jgi:ribosomal protein S18 acetylase RimI-like enzyme
MLLDNMLIRRATSQDVPYVVDVFEAAFANDELLHWLSPLHEEYPSHAQQSQLLRSKIQLLKSRVHGYVALTEPLDPTWTGNPEIAGYTFWKRNGSDDNAMQWFTPNTWFESKSSSWFRDGHDV